MDDKPPIDISRFQLKKIKGKYIIKFGLYIIILLSLWFWYQNRTNSQKPDQVKSKVKTENTNDTEIENVTIEQ